MWQFGKWLVGVWDFCCLLYPVHDEKTKDVGFSLFSTQDTGEKQKKKKKKMNEKGRQVNAEQLTHEYQKKRKKKWLEGDLNDS